MNNGVISNANRPELNTIGVSPSVVSPVDAVEPVKILSEDTPVTVEPVASVQPVEVASSNNTIQNNEVEEI